MAENTVARSEGLEARYERYKKYFKRPYNYE